MDNPLIQTLLKQQSKDSLNRHRRLYQLRGQSEDLYLFLNDLFASLSFKAIYIYGKKNGTVPNDWRVMSRKTDTYIGTECDAVVIDGFDGIDPNVLGAASGTIRAGGMLFLLLPEGNHESIGHDYLAPYWPFGYRQRCEHRFLKRVLLQISADQSAIKSQLPECLLSENDSANLDYRSTVNKKTIVKSLTKDQCEALCAIEKVVSGRNKRPLVMTADRGRGKSYLLGHAAKAIQDNGRKRVIITASRNSAVASAFFAAGGDRDATELHFESGGSLEFIALDVLVADPIDCDLLLVDEAAAIPVFMLETLVESYGRIVFSSTVHGYEGHGRGFGIAFKKTLNRIRPQWRACHLEEPVRWAENDPLEKLVGKLLLLDADIEEVSEDKEEQIVHQEISQDDLINDEQLLQQCFGLLVHAHYQTSPADLLILLDSPSIRLFITKQGRRVVGICMLSMEGGFEGELDLQIHLGHRRPRGHLVPQSLSFHGGLEGAAVFKTARVMRIATHPDRLRQNIASDLLQIVEQQLSEEIDYLSTAFSITPDVCGFWMKNGYQLLRAGVHKEAATGAYSFILGKVTSNKVSSLFKKLREKQRIQLPALLRSKFTELPSSLALSIYLLGPVLGDAGLTKEDVNSFLNGNRPLDTCKELLLAFLWSTDKERFTQLQYQDQILLVSLLCQNKSVSDICRELNLLGEKALVQQTKKALCQLVSLVLLPDKMT